MYCVFSNDKTNNKMKTSKYKKSKVDCRKINKIIPIKKPL